MGNITEGCECIIINSPIHNGKKVTAVRKLTNSEHVLNDPESKYNWLVEGETLPEKPKWSNGHVARQSQLLRIDNHNPSLEEIAELINDEVKS